jgi:hypothetical protein
MLEPLLYETARIGETVGPFAYVVPEDFNRQRLASYAISDASFLDAPNGRAYAEPSFLCGQHSWVMRRRFSWDGSVHAKCDIAYLKPVHVGATIHVTGLISGKYERRGGRYVVFELQTADDDGDPVCRVENTMLLNFGEVMTLREHRREGIQAPAEPPPVETAGPALVLSLGPKPLRRGDILRFFQAEEGVYGPHPSIHNSAGIAQAAGLADIIAPGRYSIGLLNCLFARTYGSHCMRGARYSVSFRQNLLPGIVVHVQASPGGSVAASDTMSFTVGSRDAATDRIILSGTASLSRHG